ncbi:MAG: hypothetical protein HKP60_04050 [Eudoraea sp.]|nr:hypothetical protein [Eudoraea sp.]NNJ40025.1 hypothetical protein [Eudoraea sp.]
MKDMYKDKSSLAIGGGTLLGVGSAFFFLTINVMWFVGCIILGVGLGLLIAALIPSR